MSDIVIESHKEAHAELDRLAALIRLRIPDLIVSAPLPEIGGRWSGNVKFAPSVNISELYHIVVSVSVPWEALTGAAASLFLESVREWVTKRIGDRKLSEMERIEADKRQMEKERKQIERRMKILQNIKVKPWRPRPVTEENRYRYSVEILGPNKQVLAIVRQETELEKP